MFKPIHWTITGEEIRSYAEVSGDFNPIHTDPIYAEKAGLKGCIAHGMLVMALGSRALNEWKAGELTAYDARFQAMTYPDEPLIITGSWTNEEAGKGSVTVQNEEGEVKMKGSFTVK